MKKERKNIVRDIDRKMGRKQKYSKKRREKRWREREREREREGRTNKNVFFKCILDCISVSQKRKKNILKSFKFPAISKKLKK
jgi:hypothetical protein